MTQNMPTETSHRLIDSLANPAIVDLPDDEQAYLVELVCILRDYLADQLVGVYLFGSAAYGEYRKGVSDLDIQVVVSDPLVTRQCLDLANLLSHSFLPCPAKKLDFVVYLINQVQPVSDHVNHEFRFTTGDQEQNNLVFENSPDGRHWYLLDIGIGRLRGVSLYGPEAEEIFTEIPQQWVLSALNHAMCWHSINEPCSANFVLNLCRTWRFIKTGDWVTKREGGNWAYAISPHQELIRDALAASEFGNCFDPELVKALADDVAKAFDDKIVPMPI